MTIEPLVDGEPAPINPNIREIWVEIIAGCSDSRDISSAFNMAAAQLISEKLSEGILIDKQRISIPGVFATSEIIAEVKSIIFEKELQYFEYLQSGIPVKYTVHMMSHGNAVKTSENHRKTFSYHDIAIQDCAYNCGMMQGQQVAFELELLLLSEKPDLSSSAPGRDFSIRIRTEADIEKFMQNVHGWNGTIAGNWIRSILNLATHPYEQKKLLRAALDADPETRKMRIGITAGVQNYATNDYFRVDGNTHLITFIDEVYERIRHNGVHGDEAARRIERQKPEILAFHHGEIQNARARIAKEYSGSEHPGGLVFAIAGMNAPQHYRLFGPTKTAGFFMGLSPNRLGLAENLIVSGRNKRETEMMAARLRNSPLVKFAIDAFGAKVHRITIPAHASGRASRHLAAPATQFKGTQPIATMQR